VVSGPVFVHLEYHLPLIAKIDRGKTRVLRLPFGEVLLVVAPAGEEVLVAKMKQELVAA
jgi:hypothetical protein